MLRRFSVVALAATFLLLSTSMSRAAEPDVVVVRVVGESLDADAIRAAIAKELGAAAVSDSDSRAERAAGRIDVEAKGGKLRVTYQKLGAPVTRAVDLPSDADAVRRTVVALAGNVARDEASEILASRANVESAPPKPSPVEMTPSEDAAATARLRATLEEHASDERRFQHGTAITFMVLGGAAVAGGIVIATAVDHQDAERVGLSMGTSGGAVVLGAFVGLLAAPDTYGPVIELLDRDGRSAALLKWRQTADDARGARQGWALFAGGVGVLALSVGIALPFVSDDARSDRSFSTALGALGAAYLVLAPILWFRESPIESNYKNYTTATGTTASAKPLKSMRASAFPTNGGGMVTLGLSF